MNGPVTSVNINPVYEGIISATDYKGNIKIWNFIKFKK